MNCVICSTPFEPTNKKHQHCGNSCSVALYAARKKVRLSIKAALKALKTPEEVNQFNQTLEQLLEGAA
jgi:predicted nucleic acid-binding Zn ribbon protein